MARQITTVRCGVGCGEALVLLREGNRFMLCCPPGENPGGHTHVYLNPGDMLPADFVQMMRAAREACERRRDAFLAAARDDHQSLRAVHARRAETWAATAALYVESVRLYEEFHALTPATTETQPQPAHAAAV